MIVGLKKQPHLVWNGSDFAPGRPAPPPKLKIDVTLMRAAHIKFGCYWKEQAQSGKGLAAKFIYKNVL